MEKSRRFVQLTVLIYFIYGVMSFFQFQAFVVPVVASEIFIGIIAVTLAVIHFRKERKLYFYLILFGVSSLLFAPTVLDIFMSNSQRLNYENEVSDYVALTKLILLTVLLFYLALQRVLTKIRINLVPFIVIAGIWTASLLEMNWIHQLVLTLFSLVLFIGDYKTGSEKKEMLSTFPLSLFFLGMGGILGLDLITAMLNGGVQ